MSDIYSPKKRSKIMSEISGRNTQPEILIRKLVHDLGFKFILYLNKLPGKPDLVFPKKKKIIFVNGCFWHGHKNCKHSKLPATNLRFWKNKILDNIQRDKKVRRELNKKGWKTLTIWQCQLGKSKQSNLQKRIKQFLSTRKSDVGYK